MLAIVIATLIPGLLWLLFFYRRDRFEAEPPWLVLRAFVYGSVSIVPAIAVELPFQRFLVAPSSEADRLLVIFVVVGLGEELAKFAATYLAVWHSRHFNEVMDGIVYAVAAALGFATVENVVYTSVFGLHVAPARALVASLAHACFSGVMGFYLGWGRLSASRPGPAIAFGIGVAAALHGAYDYLLLSGWAPPAVALAMVAGLYALLSRKIRQAVRLSPFRRD
ncbi:MAG: hypothetical protein BAA04_03215 [Firmicutes bacterium ZCTH02-B6]|nr:MAG: hypothetical protein BAA04_03215 [Firmicutes bacterium ZCTH02-B6]